MSQTAYQQLVLIFTNVLTLTEIEDYLEWDGRVMMPAQGHHARGRHDSTLKRAINAQLNDPRVGELIEQALGETKAGTWEHANVLQMRRRWQLEASVPANLVGRRAEAISTCVAVWRDARAADDFASLAPHLQTVFDLTREVAQARAERLGCGPYDALMLEYQPGIKEEDLVHIFDRLEGVLPDLVQQIVARQQQGKPPVPFAGTFSDEVQRTMALNAVRTMGFDLTRGRLDLFTGHPFCVGGRQDTRLTSWLNGRDPTKSLIAAMHEAGHGLYAQGLPDQWDYQPVGQPSGMGTHETQSLFWERCVGRTDAFAEWMSSTLRIVNPPLQDDETCSTDNIARHLRHVQPGLIRVHADEVCYPAHVSLRFNLERSLLSRELQVTDLPHAWNEGMQRLLGITPSNNKDGCMQDVHWPSGLAGYFPTYTLGAIGAAQLYRTALRACDMRQADVWPNGAPPLLNWLRTNVHTHGSFYGMNDMLERATGSKLDPEGYVDYLRDRYLNS